MPTHLPIKDMKLEPQDAAADGQHIGDEISWEYAMKRGSLYVKRYIRPKYARPNGGGITMAPLPPRAIEKGNADASLLAHIIVEKYLYHIPLDRQRRKFWTEYQVKFAESTLCDWVRQSCFWFEPVYRVLVEQVQHSSYIQADETPIPVLTTHAKGKTHRGYYWVYHAVEEKIILFSYSRSRSRHGPNDFLKHFRGTLQVDGYAGYNEVVSRQHVTWAACMAHVRRKFEESLNSSPDEATYALEAMKPWFAVEKESKQAGLDSAQRLAAREEITAPAMNAFHGWLKQQALTALPKSPLGKAVAYALNQWKGFDPFLNDGRIELSNNLVENAIRPVALGRKNYLFKGSHDSAQRGAMIYSLAATIHKYGCDPYLYLKHLLTRLPAAQSGDIHNFTAANWVRLYKDAAIKEEEDGD
jgi:transposase